VNEPCICVAVRRLARKATAFYEAELRSAGLTLTQYSALVRLERRGGCSLSELAAEVDLDLATLSRKVAPLVACGWLSVAADAHDRRAKRYALTARGTRALRRAERHWRRAQASARRILPAKDVEEIGRLAEAFGALAAARA
jgi:DNA-binding MarR family transcriptional regulator